MSEPTPLSNEQYHAQRYVQYRQLRTEIERMEAESEALANRLKAHVANYGGDPQLAAFAATMQQISWVTMLKALKI